MDHSIEECSDDFIVVKIGEAVPSTPSTLLTEADKSFDSEKGIATPTLPPRRRWLFPSIVMIVLAGSAVAVAMVLTGRRRPPSSPSASNAAGFIEPFASDQPSLAPVFIPKITNRPTLFPTMTISAEILIAVSEQPSKTPIAMETSSSPSLRPSKEPSIGPTLTRSEKPSKVPSTAPTVEDCSLPLPGEPVMTPLPGKRGIGFTLRQEGSPGDWVRNIPRVIALNASWNYAWGPATVPSQPESSEFVPMIWGGKNLNRTQDRIDALLPSVESGSFRRLLGFNEPDMEDQANMTVEQASLAWPILEQAGLPLVSPSVAHVEGRWLREFMEVAKQQCHKVAWIGVHWYGGANFGQFEQQMTSLYTEFQRPLLLTEFAPADWTAKSPEDNRWSRRQVLSFMKQALPWMEKTEWIAGYSWFSFEHNSPVGTSSSLFDESEQLNPLGLYYASVTSSNPQGDLSIEA